MKLANMSILMGAGLMRNSSILFITLFLIVVALSSGLGMASDSSQSKTQPQKNDQTPMTANPRETRTGLAVLKFANTTPEERAIHFQPWELGIATMLMTDLEQTKIFNIVARDRLNDILKEYELQQAGLIDPLYAVNIGKLTAAKYILTGSFMEMNGELKITANVISVENGLQLGAASAMGRTDNFFMVEKDLFNKVIEFLKVMLTEEEKARIANKIETKSVEASLKNYSGEMATMKIDELKKAGKAEEAAELKKDAKKMFKEALKEDPAYQRPKENMKKFILVFPMTL